MPKLSRGHWTLFVLILALAVGGGWALANTFGETGGPTPPGKNAQTITVTIPPDDSTGADRAVEVSVPDSVIEKLGPPREGGAAKILAGLWPAAATLFGAAVGGGVTLWANRQQSEHEQATAKAVREQAIRDRSFQACADVIKAGRLAVAAADSLWKEVYDAESPDGDPKAPDRVVEKQELFEIANRSWYSTGSAAWLALPPAAKESFDEYAEAVAVFLNEVTKWRNDVAAGASDVAKIDTRSAECERLHNETLAKRGAFLDLAKAQFDEQAWSAT